MRVPQQGGMAKQGAERDEEKVQEPAWRGVIKRLHFPIEIILLCISWYVAYPLSLRHLQEMMEERGVSSKTIEQHGIPRAVVIDKSGSNIAALADINDQLETKIEVRQIKYLNNTVEQDHQAVKRMIRPMLGFKSFYSTRVTLCSIEIMHMLKKGKMQNPDDTARTPAQQFYMLLA